MRITDQAGAIAHSYSYDAWGNIEAGADRASYAFTGREWDPETGLYYYRARYYDPTIGRFISEDPIGLFGGVNVYSYVGDAPTQWVDPPGLLKVAKGLRGGGPKTADRLDTIARRITLMTRKYAAMMKYGRSTSADVDAALSCGTGPEVRMGPGAPDWNGRTAVEVDAKGNRQPLYIELAKEVVEAFEKGTPGSEDLLDSTIEHEIVHWLDNKAPGPMYPSSEVGKAYEVEIYGRDVGRDVLRP